MELGYFTMPLHPPGSNITKTMDDDLEQLVFLDNLNHKEAWIGEHFTSQWENIWIVGYPDEVATKIRDLHQEVGGFGVLLAMGHEWSPLDKWQKSMELLTTEVLPKAADLKY